MAGTTRHLIEREPPPKGKGINRAAHVGLREGLREAERCEAAREPGASVHQRLGRAFTRGLGERVQGGCTIDRARGIPSSMQYTYNYTLSLCSQAHKQYI